MHWFSFERRMKGKFTYSIRIKSYNSSSFLNLGHNSQARIAQSEFPLETSFKKSVSVFNENTFLWVPSCLPQLFIAKTYKHILFNAATDLYIRIYLYRLKSKFCLTLCVWLCFSFALLGTCPHYFLAWIRVPYHIEF